MKTVKNTIVKYLFGIVVISIAFPQLYDGFDIPTFQYKSLQVNGSDLLNYHSQGDATNTMINLGGGFNMNSQSPEMTYGVGTTFSYDNEADVSGWNLNVPFNANRYLVGGSKGAFGFAEGDLDMNGGTVTSIMDDEEIVTDYELLDDKGDLNLTIGAGYGRVISARPVAQAAAIAGELGGDISDDAILEMAGIISKWGSGWYSNEHKDNAAVQYYNDLANASGNPDAAMKIQQIATSPVYSISDRSTGWSVQAGLNNNYMQADGEDNKGMMTVEAKYARPIDMDKQVRASFKYETGMTEGAGDTLSLGVDFSMDHTYTWATTAGFSYKSNISGLEGVDPENTIGLNVSTTKAIINRLTGTATLGYNKVGDDDAVMDFNISFNYWIF